MRLLGRASTTALYAGCRPLGVTPGAVADRHIRAGLRYERAAGPGGGTGLPHGPRSEGADVVSLRALGALGGGVFHLLVFIQGAVAAGVDGRVVNEDVGAAVIGGDEAVSLVCVEPLHGSLSHLLSPSGRALGPARPRGAGCWCRRPQEFKPSSNGQTPTAQKCV